MANKLQTQCIVRLLRVTSFMVAIVAGHVSLAVAADTPASAEHDKAMKAVAPVTLNRAANGYRGIWYHIGSTKDEFKYKYSGGLGTYCDCHYPQAIYCPQVKKTFFCYGGAPEDDSSRLLHLVSYYDHETGTVPQPTFLLDKQTNDAHDNPVISVDGDGHIWIFSTSHGRSRPSFVHRSKRPYDVSEFKLVPAMRVVGSTKIPFDNFSYVQTFYDRSFGFTNFFTRYRDPAIRTTFVITSVDGIEWSEATRLAAMEEGQYQVSAVGHGKIGTYFNMHPNGKGVDWRTNLYYMESFDQGKTWQTVDGKPIAVPLIEANNLALVHDYQAEGLLVYLKDLCFDSNGHPVIAYLTSKGHEPGMANDPRTLRVLRWTGRAWEDHPITTTDHNYDSLALYLESDHLWRAIGPTEPGPQPFGTGGEMVMWTSSDHGTRWSKEGQLTWGSKRNHTYARRPLNAHPDFYALWADGNARKPSESWLYFCNQKGDVYRLPRTMDGATAKPERVDLGSKELSSRSDGKSR
jgi:hypothetical protein